MKHWLADKDRDAFRLHGELSQVAVVSKLMHVVEQMVNSLAGSAQHLEITGAMRCVFVCVFLLVRGRGGMTMRVCVVGMPWRVGDVACMLLWV